MKLLVIGFGLFAALLGAQTKVIAHRGYWKASEVPQNSIASLEAAQKLGVYGSEFDVQRTLDGKLVINHDADFQGKVIAKTTFKELKKFKLSNGEKIPTLRKYLKQGKKDPNTLLIVELKPAASKELEPKIVEDALREVRRAGVEKQSVYISFSLGICLELKRHDPSVHVQYLGGEYSPRELKEKGIDGLDYHHGVLLKNPTWIKEAKTLGLSTNSWTVNDIEIYKKLKELGLEQVTTDIPEQIKNK